MMKQNRLKNHEEYKINLIKEAEKIGEYLLKSAIYAEDGVSWNGLKINLQGQWISEELEIDFYEGTSGIALFLGHLGIQTNRNEFIELSKNTIKTAFNKARFNRSIPSAFYGTSSLLYPITQLSNILDETTLLKTYEQKILRLLEQNIKNDFLYDYTSGSAGIITILLNKYEKEKDEKFLNLAIQYGDHLFKEYKYKEEIWTCILNKNAQKPLIGLAHGVTGIMWPLFRLSQLTKNIKYKEIAQKSLEYERQFFDQQNQNWLDLRKVQKTSCNSNWCNGNSGIALAKVNILDSYQDSTLEKEINIALKNTITLSNSNSHCLCHGTLGNADILFTIGSKIKQQKLIDQAQILMINALDDIKNKQYKYGTPENIVSLGLFMGLSGIGYQLLRFANPQKIPSLFLL